MKIRFAIPLTLALCMFNSGPDSTPTRTWWTRVHSRGPLLGRAVPAPKWNDGKVAASTSLPHVNNDHWYGHDRPNDRRYAIGHPTRSF
jgi:hypothetical protein